MRRKGNIMSDADRRLAAVSHTPNPPDAVETPAEDHLVDRMIRRPTEADFAEVLSPEGNESGDIAGSDISDSTAVNNGALGGTG
jgi:hypothetical protein